jgi:DedD protein
MPESADVNLDDLKRRARRRLVGAIVLALAAAVFVPMLLESDPRPLGDDVSVKIPPVDDGKFVNRLNESKAKGAGAKVETPKAEPPKAEPPAAEASKSSPPPPPKEVAPEMTKDANKTAANELPAAAAMPPPKKSLAEAEQRVLSPNMKSTAKPLPPPEIKVPPVDPAKTAPPPMAKTEPAPAPAAAAANGAFVVQLAAFIDDKGANALANKLKKAGYAVYTEPLTTSRGTLWRVRVGPYPTRDAAVAAREKLKTEGQNGIVAAK